MRRITLHLAVFLVAVFAFAGPGSAGDPRIRFDLTDEPGPWFKNQQPLPGTSASLAVAPPGVRVDFKIGGETETVHTITSLLWPLDAQGADPANMPFDQVDAHRSGGFSLRLGIPGLYVFTCKVHPYMFAAVIVDNPRTPGFDLGEDIRLLTGVTVPTTSDLAARLLRTFFVVTDPKNWQDYTVPAGWNVTLPPIPVRVSGGAVINLSDLNITGMPLALSDPATPGVGQVWVDTQFERTSGKGKVGTATAVDTVAWNVDRKVALPEIEMNHPHNMWSDVFQDLIYQTMWFDSRLAVFSRSTGALVEDMTVGDAPAHVMTDPVNDRLYVTLNGANDTRSVVEIDPQTLNGIGRLDIGAPHPHGHWIGADGAKLVTPNQFTDDSSVADLATRTAAVVDLELPDFAHPLATGMMPDGSKYYVANFLGNSISVVDVASQRLIKTIDLIANYDPVGGGISGPIGGLPIQTPVSPDGRYVVTAHVLGPTVTIIDTTTDELVLHLPCDAGCHGVQFGARAGGGYYAYVSSKFSNALIVFDPAEAIAADLAGNGDGILDDDEAAGVVGRVLLHSQNASGSFSADAAILAHDGMGGQGVLPVPNVYNGWIQATVNTFPQLAPEIQGYVCALTPEQRDPDGPLEGVPIVEPSCL